MEEELKMNSENGRDSRRTVLQSLVVLSFTCATHRRLVWAGSQADLRGAIVDKARSYYKTTDWAPEAGYTGISKTYYCNVFVADVCRAVGAATWDKIPGSLGSFNSHDPLARDWENSDFPIKGWTITYHPLLNPKVVNYREIFKLREPGDVISGGGHMGILSDDATSENPKVYSASAVTGAIEANDWSYRLPDPATETAGEWQDHANRAASRFTVRRFVGAA